ncbi:MAG: DUF167 domain-containing protein [Candidatus Brocadiia bacterium]|nr:DUF167 domain-containing protein [Candidatus Brocadiia bacterium]
MNVRQADEGVVVAVLVSPGAGRNELRGEHDGRLKVSLSAPPEKGKANRALCNLLARKLGVSRSQVSVLSGHTSRRKEVLVERASPGALEGII